jgi:hypothetical protein
MRARARRARPGRHVDQDPVERDRLTATGAARREEDEAVPDGVHHPVTVILPIMDLIDLRDPGIADRAAGGWT